MSLDLDDTFAFVAATISKRQRVLEVGTESIVLAIAAGKIETGRFAAPAGEAVTLLRRV